ncbi:MAG: hypothetical protein HYZ58_14325 [Acidobacteria bacterium]|nr:hypothetical protein [Acidobacteriota bacterium]
MTTTNSQRHAPRGVIQRTPILPERVRSIAGQSFAFVPHRFLREGFFASLRPDELRLYVLLVLAADRNGVSFYHYDSICSLLQLPLESYLHARNALIAKDLIAFDGTRFQVLSLPERTHFEAARPLTTDEQFEAHDPATIRRLVHGSLSRRDEDR